MVEDMSLIRVLKLASAGGVIAAFFNPVFKWAADTFTERRKKRSDAVIKSHSSLGCEAGLNDETIAHVFCHLRRIGAMKLKSGLSQLPALHLMGTASGKEESDRWHLVLNLEALQRYTRQFEYAVRLADHAEAMLLAGKKALQTAASDNAGVAAMELISARADELRVFNSWITMAAKDAALALDHFEHLRRAISAAVAKGIPTIAEHVNRAYLKDSYAIFRQHFPNADLIRDAVAHEAERASTAQAIDEHAFSGSFKTKGVEISGSGHTFGVLSERTLTMSWKGKAVSVTVDETSLERLIEVQRLILDAVAPAIEAARNTRRGGWVIG